MFELERFVEDCRAAMKERNPETLIKDMVAEAVSDPAALMKVLGEPTRGGVNALHRSDDLTVLNLCWGPRMDLLPHNHEMWAAIGIYTGKEENTFWRRTDQGLKQMGMKEMMPKDANWLADSAIHSVINPLNQVTAALHVYGGDFFAAERSEWDPATLEERAYDLDRNLAAFEESNRLLDAAD